MKHSCQLSVARCQCGTPPVRHHWQLPTGNGQLSRGFTLTEILIVIGIIVLLIAIAVPALGLLTGSRSIDRAENNISAMLGRARADALGLQRCTGVLFFIDPASQNVTLAEVYSTVDGDAEPLRLDLLPDRDFTPLPKGVMAQTIDNAVITSGKRDDDGYIGYNTAATNVPTFAQYGGVILFDRNGTLVSKIYNFRGLKDAATNAELDNLLMSGSVTGKRVDTGATIPPATADLSPAGGAGLWMSSFGLVLLDGDAFTNNANLTDPQATTPATYISSKEQGEETWIDENSVPLLINRYNGTLVRGE
jgi:prepilin-type N-terminal cleavage/methylation domain-containing protein